ncbi:hypothetical protein LA080_010169 [Diaporthe eres]|nr:hypothetical protein LA080_010169 [Diaporthe eres]
MTSAQNFEPFTFAGQEDVKTFRPLPSAEFPLALRPADGWNPSLQDKVAHAFGFVAHEEVGRPPIRTVLARNIKTANEGRYQGGETPITSGLGLARALQEQAPEFVEKLRKLGVKYVYRYGVGTINSTTGASFIDAYGQDVKPGDDAITVRRKVEGQVRRHSHDFEWHDDGSLSVTHVVPIIRKHEDYGLTTWFGALTSAWGRSRHHGATQPTHRGDDGSYHPPPLYGDGSVIEGKYLDLALSIAEASQVLVKWEQGDVVLLDPWKGSRTVLAALWDDGDDVRRISDYNDDESWRVASAKSGI